jgi:hypothetical protein
LLSWQITLNPHQLLPPTPLSPTGDAKNALELSRPGPEKTKNKKAPGACGLESVGVGVLVSAPTPEKRPIDWIVIVIVLGFYPQ